MSRRQLFHASDLARAIKVAQQAGLIVARIEIEPSGKIVIVTHNDPEGPGHHAPDQVLEAVRKKIAIRRAERLALEAQR